jgi:hypothetical protein
MTDLFPSSYRAQNLNGVAINLFFYARHDLKIAHFFHHVTKRQSLVAGSFAVNEKVKSRLNSYDTWHHRLQNSHLMFKNKTRSARTYRIIIVMWQVVQNAVLRGVHSDDGCRNLHKGAVLNMYSSVNHY